MLTLYLLRHAKSSWDDPGLLDHDRPLSPRGVRAARAMARYLEREGIQVELVLCSSATRARETCELALADAGPESRICRELYMATPTEMLTLVGQEADPARSVMLVGHNPGMEYLAQRLCQEGDPELLDRLALKYPTAALAEIEFPADSWLDVRPGMGRLRRFIRPKDLPEAHTERL